jgi:hypothetical protein
MAALDRAAILGAVHARVQRVPVPEWGPNGAEVFVRRWSVADWKAIGELVDKWKASNRDGAGSLNLQMAAFISSVCDEHGVPLFTEADLPELMKQDFVTIQRVASAALELNSEQSENAKKNSQQTPSDASPSG